MRHGTLSRMSTRETKFKSLEIRRSRKRLRLGQRLIRARDEIGREGRSMIAGQDSWMIEREEIIIIRKLYTKIKRDTIYNFL